MSGARPTGAAAEALIARLTAMADDELVLGHRDSEWTGHAPLLEEDIALASIAQDEIGHALLWLEARAEIDGSDPDAVVYGRDAGDYRNARLVELPRGDWALTMLRQFLFDAHEASLVAALEDAAYEPVARAAAKIRREEVFHLRHSRLWVERLGRGTDTSARRMRAALELLWPHLAQLLAPLPGDDILARGGLLPDLRDAGEEAWERIGRTLRGAGLEPGPRPSVAPPPRSLHGESLVSLLIDLQSVARADPEATSW